MGIFDKFKRNKKDETAAAAVAAAEDTAQDVGEEEEYLEPKAKPAKPDKKKNIFNTIGDITETVKGVKSSFDEVYSTWIKPIMDNRAQIKRRWNGLVTAISVIFFLLYVPILLFSKISKGLSLGWDIALYTCIGVYVAAVVVMLVITVASGKSTSTQASKRWRKASSVILFVVRIASFALSITAIVVSGSGESTALDTVLMVLAVTSIIFTSLSLIFGGAVGFFKWLISPAKIRRKFSFVAFEWKQSLDDGKRGQDKKCKKAYVKNADRVAECLDNYLLPTWGKAYIDTVDADKIEGVLNTLPEEERNICEWAIKDLFDYALTCKYVADNPCERLELEGDIVKERPPKRQKVDGGKGKGLLSLFKRKSTPDQAEDTQDAADGEEE
ncbi:MAG: hypothetical protein ACI4MQ_06250 [Candidatus Coproplasma sp.]